MLTLLLTFALLSGIYKRNDHLLCPMEYTHAAVGCVTTNILEGMKMFVLLIHGEELVLGVGGGRGASFKTTHAR